MLTLFMATVELHTHCMLLHVNLPCSQSLKGRPPPAPLFGDDDDDEDDLDWLS